LGDFFLEKALSYRDVADELAFESVVETTVPGEFAELADVVEDGSRNEEVGVDLGVEGSGGEAEADEMQYMLEETTDPGVMEAFGRWGFEELGAEDGVVEEGEALRPWRGCRTGWWERSLPYRLLRRPRGASW